MKAHEGVVKVWVHENVMSAPWTGPSDSEALISGFAVELWKRRLYGRQDARRYRGK